MAKLRVFSVLDAKTETFMRPFMDLHLGAALRNWEEACNEPSSPFSKFPSDFVLYEVGEFDDQTGIVSAHTPIRRVSSPLEVLKRPSSPQPLFDNKPVSN